MPPMDVKRARTRQYIIENIKTGKWPQGYPLPTVKSLAALLKVGRSTVLSAINGLIADGLINPSEGWRKRPEVK